MPAPHALGIDIGTTKICAALVDLGTRSPVRVAARGNDATAAAGNGSRHEQCPARILEIVAGACREALSESAVSPADIAAVAITGQMHGVLLADRGLKPKTPLITWRDQRAAGQFLQDLHGRLPEGSAERAGCLLHSGYGGASLAWLAAQGDLGNGAVALTIADYLGAVLTGIIATDLSHAGSWGLLDLTEKDWDQTMLEAMGIPAACLPEVREDPVLGTCASAAGRFGLRQGTPVGLPMGDNQASVYGAANGDLRAAVINIGTGGQISVPADAVILRPGIETRPMPGAAYLHVGASLCGGWSYAYLCQFFRQVVSEIGGVELSAEQIYARMGAVVKAAGESSLTVNPRFAGSRGDPSLRGAIAGIDEGNLTPANLSRAFLSAMVEELADLMDASSLRACERVVATGNAVRRNPAMVAMIESRFGLPCSLAQHQEEAALGAVLRLQDSGKAGAG